jgi:hypothetical protein
MVGLKVDLTCRKLFDMSNMLPCLFLNPQHKTPREPNADKGQ